MLEPLDGARLLLAGELCQRALELLLLRRFEFVGARVGGLLLEVLGLESCLLLEDQQELVQAFAEFLHDLVYRSDLVVLGASEGLRELLAEDLLELVDVPVELSLLGDLPVRLRKLFVILLLPEAG